MKFNVGDKVRLISDEYRLKGCYGGYVSKSLDIKPGTVLHPDFEFKKMDELIITEIFEEKCLVLCKKSNIPWIKFNIVIHIDDIERIEE